MSSPADDGVIDLPPSPPQAPASSPADDGVIDISPPPAKTGESTDMNAGLNSVASKAQKIAAIIGRIGGSNPDTADADALFNRMGGAVAEKLGQGYKGHQANPYVAAGIGTLISLANPENWLTPAKGTSVNIRKPLAQPPEAAGTGVTFSRPEITQDPLDLSVQRVAQETPVGGVVINPFKEEQAGAIEDFRQAKRTELGTDAPPSETGNTMRKGVNDELGANDAQAQSLYNQVPKETIVPMPGLVKAVTDLLPELPESIAKVVRKYLPQVDRSTDSLTSEANADGSMVKRASPGEPQPIHPRLADMMTLRSRLTALSGSSNGLERLYGGILKRALNGDIDALGANGSAADKLVGSDTAGALDRATNYYREKMTLENHPMTKALQNAPASELAETVFNKNRSVEDLQVARASLGEVGFKAAQREFFTKLLDAKNIGKAMGAYTSEFLQQALTADQRAALETVHALKTRAASAGNVAPMAGSSKMNMWLALAHGVVTAPMKTLLTGGVLPYGVAKALLNTDGLSIPVPPASLPAIANAGRATR